MIWGRIKTTDGRVLCGEICDGWLTPYLGIGQGQTGAAAEHVQGATILAPVQPGEFIGLLNNSRAAADKNGYAIPEHPLCFLKPATSVVGQHAEVIVPPRPRPQRPLTGS